MKTLFLFLLTVVAFIGCGDTTDGGNSDPDPQTCLVQADCDDGLYCINNLCQEDNTSPNSCNTNQDCLEGYFCNFQGKCELKTCSVDDDCGTGEICEDESCIDGCRDNGDCSGTQVCNENHQCEDIDDCRLLGCSDGEVCNNVTGLCEPDLSCLTDSDCGEGYSCNTVLGICDELPSCLTDQDCDNGEICHTNGYCGPDSGCNNDQYCEERSPETPACNITSGICYECTDDSYCSDGETCNIATHSCGNTQTGECQSDSDCGLNRRCDTSATPHVCVDMNIGCTSDNDCDNGLICNTNNNRCVQCISDTDCTSPMTCNTNTYLCENPGGGNGICDQGTTAVLMCYAMGGYCSGGLDSGDCIVETGCTEDYCSDYSNTHCEEDENGDPGCYCDSGYVVNEAGDACVPDSGDVCDGVTCPTNAHCEEDENGEAGCYCNSGYVVNEAGDACVPDSGDVCDGVDCSNYPNTHCEEDENGDPACYCDDGYMLNDDATACVEIPNCTDDNVPNDFNTALLISIPYNETHHSCTEQTDFFKLSLTAGDTIGVTLDGFDVNSADLDLYLLNAPEAIEDNLVASSAEYTHESFTYTADATQIYYLLVSPYGINDTSYNLHIAADVENPCEGVTCSNHGSCFAQNGVATCNCDSGYHADGLSCVLDSSSSCGDSVSISSSQYSQTATGMDFTFSGDNCSGYSQYGPDSVYAIYLSSGNEVTITASPTDPVDISLYVLSSCPSDPSAINPSLCAAGADDAFGGDDESVTFTPTTSGTYFIVVDTYSSSIESFDFDLIISQ